MLSTHVISTSGRPWPSDTVYSHNQYVSIHCICILIQVYTKPAHSCINIYTYTYMEEYNSFKCYWLTVLPF